MSKNKVDYMEMAFNHPKSHHTDDWSYGYADAKEEDAKSFKKIKKEKKKILKKLIEAEKHRLELFKEVLILVENTDFTAVTAIKLKYKLMEDIEQIIWFGE